MEKDDLLVDLSKPIEALNDLDLQRMKNDFKRQVFEYDRALDELNDMLAVVARDLPIKDGKELIDRWIKETEELLGKDQCHF